MEVNIYTGTNEANLPVRGVYYVFTNENIGSGRRTWMIEEILFAT